jgi:hypothetical protein
MNVREVLTIASQIAPILSALTAIIAAVFISRQIANIRHNREVDTLLKIIAVSDQDRTRAAKEWMMYELDPAGLTIDHLRGDKQSMAHFSQLVHLFETMGVLVNREYIPRELIFDKYGLFIAGAWGKLQEPIRALRNRSNSAEFAENFELLAMEYDAWAQAVPLKMMKGRRKPLNDARDFLDHRKDHNDRTNFVTAGRTSDAGN